jgi:hypothetical protein
MRATVHAALGPRASDSGANKYQCVSPWYKPWYVLRCDSDGNPLVGRRLNMFLFQKTLAYPSTLRRSNEGISFLALQTLLRRTASPPGL